ncbi:MAG: polysaccharide biosynthesis/export family protein [Hyphomicrobium sp.]
MTQLSTIGTSIVPKLFALIVALIAVTSPVRADGPIDMRKYHLAPGDKITVTVFGQPELSGDFSVDGAGNILLPLVGNLEVANLTVFECQDRIVGLLEDGILQKPVVNVKVGELRPIQVLGDVRSPGVYPYRFGSIVKGAIAQAGGLGFAQQFAGAAVSELLLSDERLRLLNSERKQLLVRKARLEAQRDGAKTFEETLSERDKQDADLSNLIQQEAAVFKGETAAIEKQRETIRSLKPQLLLESEAIDGQIETESKQIELVQAQLKEYRRLIEKGLGKSNSVIELQLGEANKQSNVFRLKADKLQLQNRILALEIQLNDIEATYNNKLTTQLQEAEKRIREIDVTLPSAQQLRDFKAAVAGKDIDAAALVLTLTRVQNGQVTSSKVDDTAFLEPGDILEVRNAILINDKVAARAEMQTKAESMQDAQKQNANSNAQ